MSKNPWRKEFVDEAMINSNLFGFEWSGFERQARNLCYKFHEMTGNGGYISLNDHAPDKAWELQQFGPNINLNEQLLEQMLEHLILQRDEQGRLFHPGVLHEIHISKVRSEAAKGSGGSFARAKAGAKPNSNSMSSSKGLGESEGEGETSPDVISLVEYLDQKIHDLKPDVITKPSSWSRHFDLMIRKDRRSPNRIREVIDWIFGENQKREVRFEVWSASSLRQKFDRLESAMDKHGSAKPDVGGLETMEGTKPW